MPRGRPSRSESIERTERFFERQPLVREWFRNTPFPANSEAGIIRRKYQARGYISRADMDVLRVSHARSERQTPLRTDPIIASDIPNGIYKISFDAAQETGNPIVTEILLYTGQNGQMQNKRIIKARDNNGAWKGFAFLAPDLTVNYWRSTRDADWAGAATYPLNRMLQEFRAGSRSRDLIIREGVVALLYAGLRITLVRNRCVVCNENIQRGAIHCQRHGLRGIQQTVPSVRFVDPPSTEEVIQEVVARGIQQTTPSVEEIAEELTASTGGRVRVTGVHLATENLHQPSGCNCRRDRRYNSNHATSCPLAPAVSQVDGFSIR